VLAGSGVLALIERGAYGTDGQLATVEICVLMHFRHRRQAPQPGRHLHGAAFSMEERRVGTTFGPHAFLTESTDRQVDQSRIARR
jgi:hypothetical protein